MTKVLTIEFTFLGDKAKIQAEGSVKLSARLDEFMFRHLNAGPVIASSEQSNKLYNWYQFHDFKQTKMAGNKVMFYLIED